MSEISDSAHEDIVSLDMSIILDSDTNFPAKNISALESNSVSVTAPQSLDADTVTTYKLDLDWTTGEYSITPTVNKQQTISVEG